MSTQLADTTLRAAITDANRRFMDAFRAGDADGVTAMYTPEGQLLPAQSDFVSGTEAIAGFWRGAMQMGIAAARLETLELAPHGDAAIEIGRYTLTTADGTVADHGKYVVIWQQRDGAWRLHRDIWTTSVPAQGA